MFLCFKSTLVLASWYMPTSHNHVWTLGLYLWCPCHEAGYHVDYDWFAECAREREYAKVGYIVHASASAAGAGADVGLGG